MRIDCIRCNVVRASQSICSMLWLEIYILAMTSIWWPTDCLVLIATDSGMVSHLILLTIWHISHSPLSALPAQEFKYVTLHLIYFPSFSQKKTQKNKTWHDPQFWFYFWKENSSTLGKITSLLRIKLFSLNL